MTEQLPEFDETYVREILAAMPSGLTAQQFRRRCQRDINGGYWQEVNEAMRRYYSETD